MANPRILAFVSLLAICLMLAALGVSATGIRLPVYQLPAIGFAESFEPTGNVALPSQWLMGFATGWILHWLYGIPWADLPRAFAAWLRGWRRRMAMLGLAAGCMAVLLLY